MISVFLLLTILTIGFCGVYLLSLNRKSYGSYDDVSGKICCIVPLHDEMSNYNLIVENIKMLLRREIEVIIIDDHSNDELPEHLKKDFTNVRLIHSKAQGKYQSILEASYQTNKDFLLLLDADVQINNKVLNQFCQTNINYLWLSVSVLHFRPVHLRHFIVYMEQILLQRMSFILYSFHRPILTSAAFARVSKSHYQKLFENFSPKNGGDMYIAKNTDKGKQTMLASKFKVFTTYEKNWKLTFLQRMRWLNNAKQQPNPFFAFAGYCLWLLLLGVFPLSLFMFYTTGINIYLTLNGFSLITCMILTDNVFSIKSFLASIIYCLLGWVYQLILLFLIIFDLCRKISR